MNINDILTGNLDNILTLSFDEQKEVLEQMKENKIFDLNETEKANLINFLCESADTELAIDYLFHVLDEEVSYPIDEEKVKSLFSDERMHKLKDLMMEKLQDEEETSDDKDYEEEEASDEN